METVSFAITSAKCNLPVQQQNKEDQMTEARVKAMYLLAHPSSLVLHYHRIDLLPLKSHHEQQQGKPSYNICLAPVPPQRIRLDGRGLAAAIELANNELHAIYLHLVQALFFFPVKSDM